MLRNYAEFSSVPPPYEIHPLPDGGAQVAFYYGAERLPALGDDGGERWGARFCSIVTQRSANLSARIKADYNNWFAVAKVQDEIRAARDARIARDALLAETDYLMSSDYQITDGARDAMAAYRQSLRDLPDVAGWPNNINWPEKPDISPSGNTMIKRQETTEGALVELAILVYDNLG